MNYKAIRANTNISGKIIISVRVRFRAKVKSARWHDFFTQVIRTCEVDDSALVDDPVQVDYPSTREIVIQAPERASRPRDALV